MINRENQKYQNKKRELEIYIHIPFCVRKCAYCDFLSAPSSAETMNQYVEALLQEIWEFPDASEYEVSTVFFGGGTPSILPSEQIRRILKALEEKFYFSCADPESREITIECNPGTADLKKLQAYRSMGINRLSLGLQSAENEELKKLGRIHTWETFLATYEAARKAGFENINVDLMSALPGQTVSSWERTLEKVLALQPEHISAYSLIIEEGTPFYETYGEDARRREKGEDCQYLPSEEEERQMYERTEEWLARCGMHRYEISNYALPGYECRHNCGYWRRTEYVGFGLGASSLLKNIRIRNTDDLSAYLKGDFTPREQEELTESDQMAEFMFLGLRMTEGVSEQKFLEAFGKNIDQIYGEALDRLTSQKLLCRRMGRIYLSNRGLDLANYVMAEFL